MKMIVAYIRHEAFEPIREDLLEAGLPSITITEVKGSGRQKAITEHYRGSQLAVHLRPKLKLECVVESEDLEIVKQTILRHARTGSVGDGKLFILPVEEAVRIRTGEEGEHVLQAHESEEAFNGDRP
jgi:nitrogen regulatory protein PII